MADAILETLAASAAEWRWLALAWHAAAAFVVVAVLRNRPGMARLVSGTLGAMLLSVGAVAAHAGNPFNATVFTLLGAGTLWVAPAAVNPLAGIGAARMGAAAGLAAFGWCYPHFLTGPAWHYAFVAPLGLLPCPTLAFVVGISMATDNFRSRPWGIVFGSTALFYGLVGVFVLGVGMDSVLAAGAIALLGLTATEPQYWPGRAGVAEKEA